MYLYRTFIAAAALTLGVAGTSIGQQDRRNQGEENRADASRSARRLESITWSPVDHKLTWTVNTGAMVSGKFEGGRRFSYEINMDAATMSFDGEDRRFSKQEAVSVHRLMDLVSKYAAESTLWWEAGEGEPVSGDGSSRVEHEQPKAPHRDPQLVPQRPIRPASPDSKVIRISVDGAQVPVTVRELL